MSKREQEKAIEDTIKVAEEAKRVEDKIDAVETLQEVGPQVAAQEFQSTINRSLDETKKNVRKSIDEARNQIPQYTNIVKNYQEQALESTAKMTEDYIEAQKSIINSVFDSSIPYYENVQRTVQQLVISKSTNRAMGKISQQYCRKHFSSNKNK